MRYGLLCDSGHDSSVIWFDTFEEALGEYLSYGYTVEELKESQYSIIFKVPIFGLEA